MSAFLAGERFCRPFCFALEPTPAGCEIVIREYGRGGNLARLNSQGLILDSNHDSYRRGLNTEPLRKQIP